MAGSNFESAPKTIGLTGASGMVGRAVLELCRDNAIEVRATSRRPPPAPLDAGRWRAHDLCTWLEDSDLDALYPDCGALIHAGAVVPGHTGPVNEQSLIDGNVRACLNLGEWALSRGIAMVFVSGSNVYAIPEGGRITESDRRGPSAISGTYGLSKLLAEDVFAELAHRGLSVTILRPASIYGPGLPRGKMIWRYLESAAHNETIRLDQPVDDRHNLVHARDVARACILALGWKKGGVFNIGAPRSASVEEIARVCVKAVGRGGVEIDPTPPKRPAVTRFDLDCTAAARDLGYAPTIGFEEGIRDLWLREGAG